MSQTEIVILAAGYGKRMQSELPKVLVPLREKPLVLHVLESVSKSGVCASPVIVVGQKRELVIETIKSAVGEDHCRFAMQEEQLGTGHAVLSAESILRDSTLPTIVLYGDMPYVSAETIRGLSDMQAKSGAKLVMATVSVTDFEDWRKGFFDFGRIVRESTDENVKGKILRTVEKKDATEDELKITEVNPCYFCFDSAWLWSHLKMLKNTNTQKEYYLTDLVKMAVDEGVLIESVSIDPKEALGVNTREHLELLHNF